MPILLVVECYMSYLVVAELTGGLEEMDTAGGGDKLLKSEHRNVILANVPFI
jgi:hypothetical protein